MSVPLFTDAKVSARETVREVKAIPKMAVPAYSDISKPANDVSAIESLWTFRFLIVPVISF